ncbi:MAG: putative Ig domain-containing protein [Chthoniobacteraceae bacterium]
MKKFAVLKLTTMLLVFEAAIHAPIASADPVSLTKVDQLTVDAAAIGVTANAVAAPVDPVGAGSWGPVIQWTPHIPVSAAQLPDGRLLTWAGEQRRSFDGADSHFTYAGVWDPRTGAFAEINNTNHDMFCGGVSTLPDGRVFVNGGDACNSATSVYDWRSNSWTALPPMNDTRWYNPSITLPDGGVFTVSGGGSGPNNAERWDAATGWRRLPGIGWGAVTSEPGYVNIWHPFVVLAPNGKVFHFGPTDTMHWVDVTGTGVLAASGQTVPGVHYPKEGAWVMFEEGRILVAGGGVNTTNGSDTTTGTSATAAYTVDLNGAIPQVTNVASMQFARQFANTAVLPNGEVMVIGGNGGVKFSDTGSIMTPELYNPRTNTWRTLSNMAVPRNYHSTALLLADGRVWSGGGGLGGGDHQDAQLFTPPALLNADGTAAPRPAITAGAGTIGYGQTFNISATPGLSEFAFIRMSSLTHSVNTDLRRLVLPFTETTAGNYQLTSHANLNVMTPGYWMLFGLNSNGVYSEAKIILVTTANTPTIASPGDQQTPLNRAVDLAINAFTPNGTPVFTAANLPTGLTINATTGRITGTTAAAGVFHPSVSVTASNQTVTTSFNWTVLVTNIGTGTLVREVWNNITGTTIASLTGNAAYPASPSSRGSVTTFEAPTNVADNYGQRIRGYIYAPLTGQYRFYLASDDNGQLSLSTDASPANARVIASVPDWTNAREWTKFPAQTSAPITLQAGQRYYIEALMKEGGGGDNLAVGWTIPGTSGITLITSEYLSVNNPPTIGSPGALSNVVGENVSVPLPANDLDGDALTFTAAGLPPGLGIAPNAPVISGAATQPGTYNVTITVSDGAATATATFTWTIRDGLTLPALSGAPLASGNVVQLSITGTGGANPRYTWNFGDGTPDSAWSSSGSVAHTFPGPGRYLVTVTAIDDTGRIVTSSFYQVIYAPLKAAKPTASSALAYAPAASGNARLWVANPDADTVSVLDAVTGAKLAEIAVPASPRCVALAPDGRVWVTSADAASVSILNATNFTVAQTVPVGRGARPFGLAFEPGGASAWIVLEATGEVISLNPQTAAITRRIAVGPNPRHLSINADSTRVFVSRFITPFLPGENTATIDTTGRGGEVVILNPATGAIVKTAILQHSEAVESQAAAPGIPNYLGAPVISPDGLSAWIPSKQDNIKRGQLRNGSGLTHDNTVRAIVSRLDLSTETENYAARVDFDNSGVPSAAAFDPFGGYLFVALEASRDIAIVDVWNASRIGHFDVGRAPQAVALSPNGRTLYVQNFMDRTVSLYDVTAFQQGRVSTPPLIATTSTVSTEKLAAQVLRGKQFFYDAADTRLALEGYISCAACHNDAGHDGRVWDFTGFGEGLRNTPTLKGHGAQGPSHWTGNFDEIQDFENQIRNFAGGSGLLAAGAPNPPLGAPNAGRSADLDALAAYVISLAKSGASPARTVAATLPAEAAAGRSIFKTQNCASCHSGSQFTNSALNVFRDIGTIKPASGLRLGAALTGFDVPTLRGLWATAPYLHDGSAATIGDAIRAHNGVMLADAALANLVAYVSNIDDDIAVAPSLVSLVLNTPTATVTGMFTVTATFGGAANGFTLADVAVTNGTAANFLGSGSSYSFTVTPTALGAVNVSVAAGQALDADGDPNLASNVLTVNYQQVNRPPAITAVGNQTTVRGQSASLQIVANDPDGQALTYAAAGLPSGLSINASGLISGTVAAGAAAANNVTVTVSDGTLSASTSFAWSTTAPLSLALTGRDIGSPGRAGSNSVSGSVYTVAGGGTDIWGTSDKFRFVSQTFTGDGEVIVRVTSQTNTDPWAKAGIMLRETLNANSRHAMMVLTPGNGTAFQYRTATGGASATAAGVAAAAPNNWLRLTRRGNVFTGYRSSDGITWTQVGTATVPMATAINVGICVTSHNNTTRSTATFDNLQLKP